MKSINYYFRFLWNSALRAFSNLVIQKVWTQISRSLNLLASNPWVFWVSYPGPAPFDVLDLFSPLHERLVRDENISNDEVEPKTLRRVSHGRAASASHRIAYNTFQAWPLPLSVLRSTCLLNPDFSHNSTSTLDISRTPHRIHVHIHTHNHGYFFTVDLWHLCRQLIP